MKRDCFGGVFIVSVSEITVMSVITQGSLALVYVLLGVVLIKIRREMKTKKLV